MYRERNESGDFVKDLKKSVVIYWIVITVLSITSRESAQAGKIVHLTLDSAVEIAMANSYRIKQLEMGIERTRYWLTSERAALKSKVFMNLNTPEFNAISDYKWNSTLGMDEIIRQNTRRWQMDLSVKQPVILFGYPTNGYLSLNNKIYRYLQKSDEEKDVDYYNRFFMRFEQPIFRPNELKNDIENAELNVEREELEYIMDRVNLVDHISYDFYNLYNLVYRNKIYAQLAENMERVLEIARAVSLNNSTRKIDEVRAQIELANARELLLENQSQLRLRLVNMRQRLRLDVQDSLQVVHDIKITPIDVDVEEALRYGFLLRPRIKLMSIDRRKQEISLNNVKGRGAFHLNLEMTLGLESNEDRYQAMWDKYDNSYSVSISAYVPIWDWGRRKANIEAEKINLKRSELYIEETKESIQKNISNTIINLNDYQQRAQNLRESLDIARELCETSITQYEENILSLQGILQVIDRQKETEINFLEAYLGYRRSLLSLMLQTYFDYENEVTLLEKYRPQS